MFYDKILSSSDKKIALLIDPDKYDSSRLERTLAICNKSSVAFILVGGSLVTTAVDETIAVIKKHSKLPVFLFPGSVMQMANNADGILLLSLISGRNPEFLIGNHVVAAPFLKKSSLEIIPTGYILVENGKTTSVEYISQTRPIPSSKSDIAVATAMAGEMLGLKAIYLEAGSGAVNHVPVQMIAEVRKNINIPLIVGGGIRTKEQVLAIFEAGADVIVIGSCVENNPEWLVNTDL